MGGRGVSAVPMHAMVFLVAISYGYLRTFGSTPERISVQTGRPL